MHVADNKAFRRRRFGLGKGGERAKPCFHTTGTRGRRVVCSVQRSCPCPPKRKKSAFEASVGTSELHPTGIEQVTIWHLSYFA